MEDPSSLYILYIYIYHIYLGVGSPEGDELDDELNNELEKNVGANVGLSGPVDDGLELEVTP
jgi:hypothetical protein